MELKTDDLSLAEEFNQINIEKKNQLAELCAKHQQTVFEMDLKIWLDGVKIMGCGLFAILFLTIGTMYIINEILFVLVATILIATALYSYIVIKYLSMRNKYKEKYGK